MKKYLSLDRLDSKEALYHYTRCGAVMNIFSTGVLFATKSSFLNDSNEMGYILHVAQEVIRELPTPEWRRLMTNQIIDTMDDFRKQTIYILSFSEEADAITLWAEFGEETGYNLEFDGTELLSRISARRKIYCHGRVIYSHDKQQEMIRDLMARSIPAKIGLSLDEILSREIVQNGTPEFRKFCDRFRFALNIYAMFFKQEEFMAEREYRVVFRDPEKKKIHFREKDGFLLPYIEVPITETGRIPVRSITVAPKNHIDLAREGMREFARYLGYDIPVELSSLKLRY